MKKNNNRIWLTAVLLAGTFTLQAQELPQPNPPAPGPEGPVKGAPRPPHEGRPGIGPDRRGPEGGQLIKLSTIKGTIIRAVANERFEYNSLLLKTASGETSVIFPPHLGEQILAKAKEGASVSVTGSENTDPQGKKVFRLNSIEVNGSLIADTPPVAPLLNENQVEKSFSSSISGLNYGVDKNVNGFTLSSGERVSIAPHIAQQLTGQLKTNEKIVVTGFLEPKRPGVVYSQKTSIIKARTININGQTYLVR